MAALPKESPLHPFIKKTLTLNHTTTNNATNHLPPITWFKRHQPEGIYNYYEVHGGPGKTKDGYFIAVRFLSDPPAIDVEHNYSADDGLTGTWCLYEAAEPITEAEYHEAFEKAIEHPKVVFH